MERDVEDAEIEVLDCTAQQLGWSDIRRKIESFNPDIVAASAFATCNVYLVLRTLEIVKNVNPEIFTVTGGQHFTVTAQESLSKYPEIDVVVRGEGKKTLTELVNNSGRKSQFPKIKGNCGNWACMHGTYDSRPISILFFPLPGFPVKLRSLHTNLCSSLVIRS